VEIALLSGDIGTGKVIHRWTSTETLLARRPKIHNSF
jgi:hypothetical protein